MCDMEQLPIEGPSVWYSDDVTRRPEWNVRLSSGALNELEAIRRDPQVAAPELKAAASAWRDWLEEGSGVVRITGFPSPGRDDDSVAARFAALVGQVGTAVSQSVDGERIFRVEDAGLAPEDQRARGPNSRRGLTFHSDRCDVIGFLCVRQATRGGENLVVSAGAVHNAILEQRPELLDTLYRPFWWQRHNIDSANDSPFYAMPVFAREEGRFAVTLMQVLIERAHRSAEVPDLTSSQREALDLVQQLAADPRLHHRFRLEPGEILLLNNFATLHSRTEFEDRVAGHGRLLLRTWLSVPNSRPLPRAWIPHYGGHEAGSLRGGIRRSR
jgi:hypothetical protein